MKKTVMNVMFVTNPRRINDVIMTMKCYGVFVCG